MDYMTYVQRQGMKTPKGKATPHAAGALFDVCRNIVLHTLDVISEHGLINVPQELYEKVKGLRHTWKGEARKPVSVQCSGMTKKRERCKRRVRVDKGQQAAVCRQHDPSKLLFIPDEAKAAALPKLRRPKKKKDRWSDFVWGDSASWSIVLGLGPNGTRDLTHQNLLEIAEEFGYQYLNGEWCLADIPSKAEEAKAEEAKGTSFSKSSNSIQMKEETLEDHVKISFVRLCRNLAKNHEYKKVIDMINAKGKEVSTDVSHPLRAFLRDFKNEIWDDEEKWENEGQPCTEEQRKQIDEYLEEKQRKMEKEEQIKISTEQKEEEERENERRRRANRKQCDLNEIKKVEIGTDHVNKSDWKIMGVLMKELILVREGLLQERKTLLQISKEVQDTKEGKILTLSHDEDNYLFGVSFRNIDSLRQQDYTSVFHVLKSMPTKDYVPIGTINLFDYIEDLCNMYVPDQLLWDILHGDELLE